MSALRLPPKKMQRQGLLEIYHKLYYDLEPRSVLVNRLAEELVRLWVLESNSTEEKVTTNST